MVLIVCTQRLGSYDSSEDNNLLFYNEWGIIVVVFNVHFIMCILNIK